MAKVYPDGIGGVARPSDAHGPISPRELPGRDVAQTIRLVNAMQKWATTKTRLGIPLLFHEAGLHRYAPPGATSLPDPRRPPHSLELCPVPRPHTITPPPLHAPRS